MQYFFSLLDFLSSKGASVKKAKQLYVANLPTFNFSCLLFSALHLSLSYPNLKPDENCETKIDQILNSTNFDQSIFPLISQVCGFIKNFFKFGESHFRNLFNCFFENYPGELMSKSVPLFTFHHLYRLHRYQKIDLKSFFIILQERLQGSNSFRQNVILIYFLKFFITIYPDLPTDLMKGLSESLKPYLLFPFPLSTLAFELGKLIMSSTKYPGIVFYKTLKNQIRANSLYKGVLLYCEQTNISYLILHNHLMFLSLVTKNHLLNSNNFILKNDLIHHANLVLKYF
jgi:hypothetical protein